MLLLEMSDYQPLSAMEYLEFFAAKTLHKMRAKIAGEPTDISCGDPVRYIGRDFPELFNHKGVIVNSWLINGMVIVHFPRLGEWNIKPENLVRLTV